MENKHKTTKVRQSSMCYSRHLEYFPWQHRLCEEQHLPSVEVLEQKAELFPVLTFVILQLSTCLLLFLFFSLRSLATIPVYFTLVLPCMWWAL